MHFEQTVVIPLPLRDAQRLLDEIERSMPDFPGLQIKIELALLDERSTSVRLVGEFAGRGGLGSALLLESGVRLLRRYADQVVARAKSSAAASSRARAGDGSRGSASAGPSGPGFTLPAQRPLALEPVVWVGAGVAGLLILRRWRRKKS